MALTSTVANGVPNGAMSQGADARYTPNYEYSLGTRRQKNDHVTLSYEEFDTKAHPPVNADTHEFQEGEFIPDGFFNRVGPACFTIPPPIFQWTYEYRRRAQIMLPFLYLGPWGCLADRGRLAELGITLLLAIRDKRLAMASLVSGRRAAEDLQIEGNTVDFADSQELITILPRLINYINSHISSPSSPARSGRTQRKVLLFCETGNGPSAAVAIAYVMVMLNITLPQALQYVSSRRFCIDVDDSASQLLLSFESILNAKRDVERARRANMAQSTAVSNVGRKRDATEFDMVDGDGDAMAVEAGESGEDDRRPLAPFEDRSG